MCRPRLPLVACVATVLAGCGGGDEGGSGRTTTVERGQEVLVTGHEYRFDPNGIVVVGGPGKVRLRFANEGSLAHNLRVLQGDRDVGGTPTFQSGIRTASVNLAPGDYRMVCTVGDHAELGMNGTLRVRARNSGG